MDKAELKEYIKRYEGDLSLQSIFDKKQEVIELLREFGGLKIKSKTTKKEVK